MNKEILQGALVLSVSTAASAALVQALCPVYKDTPVFWLAIGATSYLGLEAVEHLLGRELVTNKTHLLPS